MPESDWRKSGHGPGNGREVRANTLKPARVFAFARRVSTTDSLLLAHDRCERSACFWVVLRSQSGEEAVRFHSKDTDTGAAVVPRVWYEVITQTQDATARPPSALLFHKLVVLARFRLEAQGIRVPIPYSWYLFGAQAEDLHSGVRLNWSNSERKTEVEWASAPPKVVGDDPGFEPVERVIHELVEQYSSEEAAELAVDEVYSHAPYDFQRRFRDVRMNLRITGRGSSGEAAAHRADLWNLALEAFDVFPVRHFPAVTPYLAPVKEAIRLTTSVGLERNRALSEEVIEGFWSLFCHFLRVDRVGHFDVEKATVEEWVENAESTLAYFSRNFGDIVVSLADVDPTVADDATLGSIVSSRRSDQRTESEEVEAGLAALGFGG